MYLCTENSNIILFMGLFTRTAADGRELGTYESRLLDRAEVPVGVNEISASRYNLIMGATVAYGLIMNVIMVLFLTPHVINFFLQSPKMIYAFFIGYFIFAIAGAVIANKSDKPFISFLGYNLIVLPVGILLCLVIPGFPMFIVAKAMALTAFVTLFMMGLGTAFPNLFLSMGRTLGISLIVTLVIEVLSVMIFGYSGTFFDIIFVLIFSLYIAYDIARSQAYAHTVDNAVDSAVDIYLDIINLFLRILAILGKKD